MNASITKTDRNTAPVAGSADLFGRGKIDGRSADARAYRGAFNDLATQMGGALSASETMLLRRAAMMALLCERAETALAAGEPISENDYRRNTAILKELLVSLGLAKKSRDVTKAEGRVVDDHTLALMGDDPEA